MKICTKSSAPDYAGIKNVTLTDSFFAPFIDRIRSVTVQDVLEKFLADGAVENYERVARGERGGHAGPPWYHGLICEVIRGVSDLLAVRYDADIDARLDGIIDAIVRAQNADPDGWINPYTTLMRPDQRWGMNGGNVRWQHETYNAGCLIEAGVHHWRAVGKTSLLRAAVKMANYLADRIGPPPKWNVVCEHSLPEMALVSLERLFDENESLADEVGAKRGEYLRLAEFFINSKGHHDDRHQFPRFLQEYAQDHRPTREQKEAVGHAVRATLFYAGIAETALADGDASLSETALTIWRDITETKLHINGSVGAFRDDERFGQQYDLPNDAYLETCAGVGLAFFGAAVFRLTRDASVWETVENTLTNLMPTSLSEDGTHYTYENPLETRTGRERWSWHPCPCCPPMLLKLAGEMPSYIFAEAGQDIWLNLFIGAEARLSGAEVKLSDGKLTVKCAEQRRVHIRIPSWTHDFSLSVNGAEFTPDRELGYAVVNIPSGETVIGISYTEKCEKIMAHPWVNADHGRVAVRRGAVLYCCEKQVGRWEELDPILSSAPLTLREDGVIEAASADGQIFELIEYRRHGNRGAMPMRVWFRQEGHVSDPADTSGWEGKLYRVFA